MIEKMSMSQSVVIFMCTGSLLKGKLINSKTYQYYKILVIRQSFKKNVNEMAMPRDL